MSFESKINIMLNQARYGKKFARSCGDKNEVAFFTELINEIEIFSIKVKQLKHKYK